MRRFWIKMVSLLLVPAMLLAFAPAASAEVSSGEDDDGESSDGAILTVGLLVVVVGVLFLIGMKADWDNVFGKAAPQTTPADREQLRRDIALALDEGYAEDVAPVLEAHTGSRSPGAAALTLKF